MIIGASSGSSFFLLIIIAFVVLYLIVVRPQKRRSLQQKQLVDELQVGDEVLTAGGIYGTITHLEEERVTVEIAPQLEVSVARRAIAGVTVEPEDEEADKPEESTAEAGEPEPDESPEPETSNEENRG